MKIKCEYCDNYIDDTDEQCSNCGGVNDHLVRSAQGIPKTIEELKNWCKAKNIPLEQARFFIGEDYKGARAFGIYQDEATENYIVYKNKSDGSRAVRYEGKDEAYAVNEIYQKLKAEMLNQKQNQSAQRSIPNRSGSRDIVVNKKRQLASRIRLMLIAMVILVAFFYGMKAKSPSRGYYEYANEMYYYQPSDGWYLYDNGDWNYTYVDSTLSENYNDYYSSGSYYDTYDVSDFGDSGYYEESSSESYDDDWDSGWDSGSDWDSGTTDWDSDW